jgi:lipopolysaccharide transport system permease protein
MTSATNRDGATGDRTVVIRPAERFKGIDFRELWAFRTLLLQLTMRRFKTTFDDQYLGLVWAVARPLLMMLVFVAFKNLSSAQVGEEIPYFLYIYSGLILWFYFVEAVMETSTAVKQDIGIIKKVYFPRIISPLSAIFGNLMTLSISAVPLIIMMIVFQEPPGLHILLLPLVLLQVALLILGAGCLFAALSLLGRDWEQLLGFSLYIGLFVSPVIFAPSLIPEQWHALYFANPMAGTLMAFRSVLFEAASFPWTTWLYSCAITVIVLSVGIYAFQRSERYFSETL